MTALASRLLAEVRGAVARGWCAPANSTKVMDTDLAEAIAQEVCALMQAEAAAALSGREAVAWLCSHPTPYGGRPFPGDIQLADVDTEDGWTERPLIYGDTTPPAPVDVRGPMSRIIELLAQLVNAPQTDDEFDADVIRRDFVMEKVTQLRMAWDELSKAQRALLSGQQAGVVIDDAMVRRAVHAYDEWMIEHAPDETDAYHDGMRAALTAALGGGGGRG